MTLGAREMEMLFAESPPQKGHAVNVELKMPDIEMLFITIIGT